jgi:hypothetical protein
MAIKRQFNFIGQQRVDLPHLKSLESSIAYDFDDLCGKALSGKQPLVLRGLTIPVTNTVGVTASALQLNVARSLDFALWSI